mmetsp:Transcript_86807/g.254041  ORF Transcript_86807/g.254041 Transcript_86807/m.254041 type:complete len:111 (+) Transcript_86807:56-388(+)
MPKQPFTLAGRNPGPLRLQERAIFAAATQRIRSRRTSHTLTRVALIKSSSSSSAAEAQAGAGLAGAAVEGAGAMEYVFPMAKPPTEYAREAAAALGRPSRSSTTWSSIVE